MRVLVTGGGGFLGQTIVRQLVARGDSVRSLSRGDYPALKALGVKCVTGDIADRAVVIGAAKGCDAVFHVAAKAGVWGRYDDYHRANVIGTENVIAACLSESVPKLIHTSSPSVVFDGRTNGPRSEWLGDRNWNSFGYCRAAAAPDLGAGRQSPHPTTDRTFAAGEAAPSRLGREPRRYGLCRKRC